MSGGEKELKVGEQIGEATAEVVGQVTDVARKTFGEQEVFLGVDVWTVIVTVCSIVALGFILRFALRRVWNSAHYYADRSKNTLDDRIVNALARKQWLCACIVAIVWISAISFCHDRSIDVLETFLGAMVIFSLIRYAGVFFINIYVRHDGRGQKR